MTDGLLRVTKYSLRSLWPTGLGFTLLLVLPPLGLRLLVLFMGWSHAPFRVNLENHFAFLGISGILFVIVCLVVLGQTQKLLPRMPVTTAEIVSGLILATLILTVVVSLVSIAIYRQFLFGETIFDRRWPVLGPTLFLVTMVVVIHCAFWNLKSIGIFKMIFWYFFGAGAIAWFVTRYSPVDSDRYFVPWKQVTPVEMLTMLVVFVTAWVVAIRSCDRVRCGAAVPSQTWERYRTELRDLKHLTFITDRKQPASLSAAFTRLYWRDSGRLAAMVIIGIGGMVFFGSLLTGTDHRDVGPLASFFFFGTTFCLPAWLGASLLERDSGQMKGYLASAPLSDRDISLVLMRTLLTLFLLSVASILLFGLVGGRLIFLLMEGTTEIQNLWTRLIGPESSEKNLFYGTGLILLAHWAFVTNLVALFWAPRRGFAEFMLSIPTIGIVTAFISGGWPAVGDMLILLMSTLIWSLTIIAYVQAYRMGLLRAQALWLAGLFCLTIPAVYWKFWSTSELPLKLLWSSLLILTVTPFASIPLAVRWRRHR